MGCDVQQQIFLSYRSRDNAALADHIASELERRYPEPDFRVYQDIHHLRGTDRLRAELVNQVQASQLMVVLVGADWLQKQGDEGWDINDVDDYVRLEVATALEFPVPVLPVCLQERRVPKAEQLPEVLLELRDRPFQLVRMAPDFEADIERLCSQIDRHLRTHRQARPQQWRRIGQVVGLAALLAAAVFFALWLSGRGSTGDSSATSPTSTIPAVPSVDEPVVESEAAEIDEADDASGVDASDEPDHPTAEGESLEPSPGELLGSVLVGTSRITVELVANASDPILQHAYIDVDGDPTTGLQRRGGADLLLEADQLRTYDPASCDAGVDWCWTSGSTVEYSATDTAAGPATKWVVSAALIPECSPVVTVQFDASIDGETKKSGDPVFLACDVTSGALVPPLSGSECVPSAWAAHAEAAIARDGLAIAWVDPDGDCVHSGWEVGASGAASSDPAVADTDGDGVTDGIDCGNSSQCLIPSLAEQLRFLTAGG